MIGDHDGAVRHRLRTDVPLREPPAGEITIGEGPHRVGEEQPLDLLLLYLSIPGNERGDGPAPRVEHDALQGCGGVDPELSGDQLDRGRARGVDL